MVCFEMLIFVCKILSIVDVLIDTKYIHNICVVLIIGALVPSFVEQIHGHG